jgi:hypothetical protein
MVRGRCRESELRGITLKPSGKAPSSQPSPRTRGEGATSGTAEMALHLATHYIAGAGLPGA